MKFSLWTNYGALNSKPVFNAVRNGLINRGHTVVENDENSNVDVIWSVLFHGRMAPNIDVWHRAQNLKKPVIVLEVGSIQRDVTWKVGLNGINRNAYLGPTGRNATRANNLGISSSPWRTTGESILICGQHNKSLQWYGQPTMETWFLNTYHEIRKYSDRPIIFRPHPRCHLANIEKDLVNVTRQRPVHINGTYDSFDLNFNNVWATVNWSSNPGVHSVLAGVPAFVSPASVAFPVANTDLANIENPSMPDRTQWINDYAWTEYTIQEIYQGLPLENLTHML